MPISTAQKPGIGLKSNRSATTATPSRIPKSTPTTLAPAHDPTPQTMTPRHVHNASFAAKIESCPKKSLPSSRRSGSIPSRTVNPMGFFEQHSLKVPDPSANKPARSTISLQSKSRAEDRGAKVPEGPIIGATISAADVHKELS